MRHRWKADNIGKADRQ